MGTTRNFHTFSVNVDGSTYLNAVIHGDLTGNNVLIGRDRTPYLADFGLSGTLTQLPGMTYLAMTSCHPGALRWSAPELFSAEGSASSVTTQSDIGAVYPRLCVCVSRARQSGEEHYATTKPEGH
ncbi:hypothetical protein BD769DRAFT_1542415 [Suillus cothurnatus]|nr:hypothetical protein BD769DRAFT_1542415 [Suillus cothurnatus]